MPHTKDENLTPEEKEINETINEADARIKDLEGKIKNLSGNGPSPQPKPKGGPDEPSLAQRAHQAAQYRQNIEQIKTGVAEKSDKILKNSAPDVRQKGQEAVTKLLYPDAKEGKQGKDGKEGKQTKDMDKSQASFMQSRYSENRASKQPDNNRQRPTPAAKEDTQDKSPEKKDEKPSASARFSMSLNYVQFEQKQNQQPNKEQTKEKEVTPEKEPDQTHEDIEPDKED